MVNGDSLGSTDRLRRLSDLQRRLSHDSWIQRFIGELTF